MIILLSLSMLFGKIDGPARTKQIFIMSYWKFTGINYLLPSIQTEGRIVIVHSVDKPINTESDIL